MIKKHNNVQYACARMINNDRDMNRTVFSSKVVFLNALICATACFSLPEIWILLRRATSLFFTPEICSGLQNRLSFVWSKSVCRFYRMIQARADLNVLFVSIMKIWTSHLCPQHRYENQSHLHLEPNLQISFASESRLENLICLNMISKKSQKAETHWNWLKHEHQETNQEWTTHDTFTMLLEWPEPRQRSPDHQVPRSPGRRSGGRASLELVDLICHPGWFHGDRGGAPAGAPALWDAGVHVRVISRGDLFLA